MSKFTKEMFEEMTIMVPMPVKEGEEPTEKAIEKYKANAENYKWKVNGEILHYALNQFMIINKYANATSFTGVIQIRQLRVSSFKLFVRRIGKQKVAVLIDSTGNICSVAWYEPRNYTEELRYNGFPITVDQYVTIVNHLMKNATIEKILLERFEKEGIQVPQ
jgi:hypothetical protein